jgi:hypothetical protein
VTSDVGGRREALDSVRASSGSESSAPPSDVNPRTFSPRQATGSVHGLSPSPRPAPASTASGRPDDAARSIDTTHWMRTQKPSPRAKPPAGQKLRHHSRTRLGYQIRARKSSPLPVRRRCNISGLEPDHQSRAQIPHLRSATSPNLESRSVQQVLGLLSLALRCPVAPNLAFCLL